MTQQARPIQDTITGSWTSTPLYEKLDEVVADDTDKVISAEPPTGDKFRVKLQALQWPRTGTQTLSVRLRHVTTNAPTVVKLLQGSTVIASKRQTPGSDFSDVSLVVSMDANSLSAGQRTIITDYTDLYVEVVAGNTVSKPLTVADCGVGCQRRYPASEALTSKFCNQLSW